MAVYNIPPIQFINKTIDKIDIYLMHYSLDNLQRPLAVSYIFIEESGEHMGSGDILFEPHEIADWNSDDRYIANKVAERLNIQLLP